MFLLITNMKSYTRFRLVPKSTTLDDPELTLNGYYALCCITHTSFGAHTKIWMKIDPYYQRQKCSPGIADSSKIRFLRIFAGVRWRGASNESGVVKNGDFRLFYPLYIPNLHVECHNYYMMLCSPTVALQRHRNRWPWMTLNDHFLVKICFGLGN